MQIIKKNDIVRIAYCEPEYRYHIEFGVVIESDNFFQLATIHIMENTYWINKTVEYYHLTVLDSINDLEKLNDPQAE